MLIQLSPEEREFLEHQRDRKLRPTRRQKATAILSLAEGMTMERIAERTGIPKVELDRLFDLFRARGLAGLGFASRDGNSA